jgi:hypothetical protein
MISRFKNIISTIYQDKLHFNNEKVKNSLADNFLFYYGVSLMILTLFSLFFSGMLADLFIFNFLVKLYYVLFYFAVLLKLFAALDELVLIKKFYTSTGMTPFLILQSTATVVKICVPFVAWAVAVLGGYVVLAGEYSGVRDSAGYVHKHTPVRSMSDYAQGKISYIDMKQGVLNPHEVAEGYAKAADVARDAAKKAALEADLKNKR